jgi:hypothetical protein
VRIPLNRKREGGRGKERKGEERRRSSSSGRGEERSRRYETCFPTRQIEAWSPAPYGPSIFPSFTPTPGQPNGRQQPPVIEPTNYHRPYHWACGPGLTIPATITTPQSCRTTVKRHVRLRACLSLFCSPSTSPASSNSDAQAVQ